MAAQQRADEEAKKQTNKTREDTVNKKLLNKPLTKEQQDRKTLVETKYNDAIQTSTDIKASLDYLTQRTDLSEQSKKELAVIQKLYDRSLK